MSKKIWKYYLGCLLIVSIIFVALYHQFLFGGQMYAYSDVGADTIDQYLPVMIYETNQLREGILEGYDLQYGLGKYTGGYLLKYLNPVNLPILLLGEEHLHIALMISLYLKYALICLFALLFFVRLLKNERAAAVCALLWTYSGYAVLWCQHYHFLTELLCFTIAAFGFLLYLENGRFKMLVIPAMAVLASISYYQLYISAFFFLGFGVLYLAFSGYRFGDILKRIGEFCILMIPMLLIAGMYLVPAIEEFFDSARTGQVRTVLMSTQLFYPQNVLVAFLARFLSNDLFGTGNQFLGPTNYYECAIIHVSLLSVFSFCYLLGTKAWKKVVGISACSIFLICMPAVSNLLAFNSSTQRWAYLLSFAQVVLIGFALKEVLSDWNDEYLKKRTMKALFLSDLLLLAIIWVIYRYHISVGGWLINEKACVLIVLLVAIYHAAAMYACAMGKGRMVLFIAAVVIELIIGNYACVNERETVSLEQWKSGMYYDGTADIVAWIREQDDSLYRINKTNPSVNDCDALIQNYNGMSMYHSVNAGTLVELANRFGYPEAGNHVRFSGTDILANTMLGVKYVIAEQDEILDPTYYEKIYENGRYCVYQNRYWLGFGYLYHNERSQQDIVAGTALETAANLSQSYYVTQTELQMELKASATMDLLPYLTSTEHCQITTQSPLMLMGTDLDMQLVFDFPQLPENMLAAGVRVRLTAQNPSVLCLLTADREMLFNEERYEAVYYDGGTGSYTLDCFVDQTVEYLRLDVSWIPQSITIESVELILVDEKALCDGLCALQMQRILDMKQYGSSFCGTVNNPSEETAMLCTALIYDDNWTATVDGQPTEVCNVNGGLLGVYVEPGETEVRIEYADHSYKIGLGLSIAGMLLFCVMVKKSQQPMTGKVQGSDKD